MEAPKTKTQLMGILVFTNYCREFLKGYADKIHSMKQLMQNKYKKFSWTDDAQISFKKIKREFCEAQVLGMSNKKWMFLLDTYESGVAISDILHLQQRCNGRTVLRPKAYGSKILSDTEMM